MGEELTDGLVIKAGDRVEGTIRGCASFCNQYIGMSMVIDAISLGLDHGHKIFCMKKARLWLLRHLMGEYHFTGLHSVTYDFEKELPFVYDYRGEEPLKRLSKMEIPPRIYEYEWNLILNPLDS